MDCCLGGDFLAEVGGRHEDRARIDLLSRRKSERRPDCWMVKVGSRRCDSFWVDNEDLVRTVAREFFDGRLTKGGGDDPVGDRASSGQNFPRRIRQGCAVMAGDNEDGIEFHFITPRM